VRSEYLRLKKICSPLSSVRGIRINIRIRMRNVCVLSRCTRSIARTNNGLWNVKNATANTVREKQFANAHLHLILVRNVLFCRLSFHNIVYRTVENRQGGGRGNNTRLNQFWQPVPRQFVFRRFVFRRIEIIRHSSKAFSIRRSRIPFVDTAITEYVIPPNRSGDTANVKESYAHDRDEVFNVCIVLGPRSKHDTIIIIVWRFIFLFFLTFVLKPIAESTVVV